MAELLQHETSSNQSRRNRMACTHSVTNNNGPVFVQRPVQNIAKKRPVLTASHISIRYAQGILRALKS